MNLNAQSKYFYIPMMQNLKVLTVKTSWHETSIRYAEQELDTSVFLLTQHLLTNHEQRRDLNKWIK